jgi:hypothetical protein
MVRVSLHRALGILGIVSIGFVCVVSGQAGTQPARSPMDELLAEVRGLRAEINQAAGASIRTQLVLARLQLQEQRIHTVAQQLTDVRNQLAAAAQVRSLMAGQVKEAGEAVSQLPADHPLMKVIEQQQKREEELKQQEASLSALLAEEQARWMAFNARLDELEQALLKTPR